MVSRDEVGLAPLPARARAAAYEMLRAIGVLGNSSMVAPFVDSYAARFDRLGLKAQHRYRELLLTIGRESLLAMTAKMHRDLPRLLTRSKRGLLRGPAADEAEAFRQKFLECLAETLEWSPADRDEFRRDLTVYTQFVVASGAGKQPETRQSGAAPNPFADRCALLLDPAMMPEARQASAKFLTELEDRAEQILRQTFGGAGRGSRSFA